MVWILEEEREESGVPHREKSIAKWHLTRRVKKHSKRGDSRKEIRRIFKMLREVWLNIGMKKIDIHEGVIVKALLDSGTIGMFMDKRTVEKHGFKLQELERLIAVRNVDGTNNSRGTIIYQVECNVYYKGHIERMRIDLYNLGKTEVILRMPWLQAHNPEIN